MRQRFRPKTDSLYHTCLKKRLSLLAAILLLPGWVSAQSIKFSDVTSLMKVPGWVTNGVSTYGHGAIWTDISGDSLPDLYIANAMRQANAKLPETLYISHAGAAYTEEDGLRGVSDMYGFTGTHGIIMADYDNDGDLDIFNATTDDRIRLYRNKGNGYFENFTNSATLASTRVTYEGYGTIGYGTRALVVFDADNDGDMDLYGANWGPVEDINEVPWVTPAQPNEFFINNGNGTYTNVSDRGCTPVNPSNEGTQGVTSVDIDEDGDMDIFVCHRNYAFLGYNSDGTANFGRGPTPAPNDLFINDGNGNFSEANIRDRGMFSESNDINGTTFADYDNDGDLDAFVVYTDETRPQVRVLQNNGKGYFTNVSATVVIEQWGFTPFIFDMDNDGDLDVFSPRTRDKGRIYLNDGTGKYVLQSNTGVEIAMYDPRGGSVADMDNDGDLDVYCVDANKDAGPYFNRMFRNDTPSSNRWLKIWGSGPKGDLGAFGTKIWLFEKGHMEEMDHLVGYKQIVNGYGYLAQDDIVQHFGVTLRDSVDVKIRMLDGTILKTRLKSNTRHYFSKPAALAIVDGDQQQVMSGMMLAQPLRVVVTDAQGKAVAGAPVTFNAAESDGSFMETQPVYTDGRGYAQISYRAGRMAGAQTIIAETGSLSVPFTVTITHSGPAVFTLLTGDAQSAYTGQILADSIRVQVTNSAGAGQANHPVRFTITAGDGKLKPGDGETFEGLTNETGIAAVAWQVGLVANSPQTLVITASADGQPLSGSPITVQATALERIVLSGRPKDLLSVSGDGQSGPAGTLLEAPFIIQLVDSLGRACPFYDIIFQITTGDGTLSGAGQQVVQTDMDGKAAVFLRLGTLAGMANNHVSARYNGLAKVIYFTASAQAGPPALLQKLDGDEQSADPGFTLPKYLRVQVTDEYKNLITGHPVTFTVISPNGFVNDQKNVTVQSDSVGVAQVLLKLGAIPGVHMVSVTATYNALPLVGSPLLFTATAITDPALLQRISADSIPGLAGQPLDVPLRVRVTDKSGYAVPNHPVTFWVRRGGGLLEGLKEIIRNSDANGIVSVMPVLGDDFGIANNVFEAQSFQEGGLHLSGSPQLFYVSARKSLAYELRLVGGSGSVAQAGEMLAQPLSVLVLDKSQQPVAGQEVLFEVVKGSGKLGAGEAQSALVQSNVNGIAQISFRLGSELGDQAHRVRASSDDGVTVLLHSPLVFAISAPYGQPDTSASTVSASTPVIADGVSESVVRVRLVDGEGHAVPGERVTLLVSGDGNRITQPEEATDAAGEAVGFVSSTLAGSKTIRIYIASKGRYLQATPAVFFSAGKPQRIMVVSGDFQSGNIQSALEKPVVVRLEDLYQNPIPRAALEFLPALGSGEIQPNQQINTDEEGLAQVTWILGPSVGKQELMVRAAGSVITRTIQATAAMPQRAQLLRVAGDGQFSLPGAIYPDSLAVRVVDEKGSPIYGIGVTFVVLQGSATTSASGAVVSDRYGLARVQLAAGADFGIVKIRAMASSAASVDFTLSVSRSVPALISSVYGDRLTGEAGSIFYPLMVRVTDQAGYPVANVPVYFQALTSGAEVEDDQPLHTGDDGQVAAKVWLGMAAGSYLYQASSSHVDGSPILFNLTAAPGPAADMTIYEGDRQSARALKALPSPVKVRISDRFGNGVAEQSVQFEPLSGGGTISSAKVTTDVNGLAAAQWTLGDTGTQSLEARCPALPGKQVRFSAVLIENLAPIIYAVDDTTVLETESLVVEVRVVDPDGGSITLTLQNLPTGATFDPLNTRLFIWRPNHQQQGKYDLLFTAKDDNGGETKKTVTIRVLNKNRPPAISLFQPEDYYYQAPSFRPVTFLVQAFDQDGDLLSYSWRLNGRLIGKKDTLSILTGTTLPAQFNLIVTVRDQVDSVSHGWSVQQLPTGITGREEDIRIPEKNRLVQNFPNPFNPETTITYELANAQKISIRIYNMSGQAIRTLYSGQDQAGYHRLRWNGQTDSGEIVPSGIYPCVLVGETFRQTIKLVFIK